MGVIFILVLGYGFGFYRINSQFKQVKRQTIPVGVEQEVIKGIQMKVNGLSYIDKEELYRTYGYKMDYEGDIRAFLVSATYSNESGYTRIIAAYNSNIERVGYSNGIDPVLYSICNPIEMDFELKNGEKKDVILTYIIMDFQFTDHKWKKMKEEDFFISTSRYPVKTIWQLK